MAQWLMQLLFSFLVPFASHNVPRINQPQVALQRLIYFPRGITIVISISIYQSRGSAEVQFLLSKNVSMLGVLLGAKSDEIKIINFS